MADKQPEPTTTVAADPPAPGETTPEELAKQLAELTKRVNEMDPRLTDRINTLNTTVAATKADLTKQIGGMAADVAANKTATENNNASIKSFTGRLDGVTQKVGDLEGALAVAQQKQENTDAWQSAMNTAFIEGIQGAKDFAQQQSASNKTYIDQNIQVLKDQHTQDVAGLKQRIEQVANQPVADHTHDFAVSGTTGGPKTKGKS